MLRRRQWQGWEIGLAEISAINLCQSVMQMTPFAYAHYTIPISEISTLSLLVLLLLSAAFTAVGLMGFKRRSIGL